MKILEKLGITPGPWECRCGWWIGKDKKCIATCDDNISSLIAAAPEMLEALIEGIVSYEDCFDDSEYCEYTVNQKLAVEKATGKPWDEIIEILNEEK